MHGGGEDWIDAPWDFITFYIMMGLALIGAGGVMIADGGQIDAGYG